MLREIEQDIRVLLERAFLDQELRCFGIDGNGQYGQSDQAHTFTVCGVDVLLAIQPDKEWPECCACLHLSGYNSNSTGHLLTDRNAEISINSLLSRVEIDPTSWDWDELHNQGTFAICLTFDVRKLISW